MKKIKFSLLLVGLCIWVHGTQAQESSLPSGFANGETTWIAKAGVSLNNVTGKDVDDMKTNWANQKINGEYKPMIGGTVTFGAHIPMGMGPLYCGTYLTAGMRGYKTSMKWMIDSNNQAESLSTLTAFNFQIAPMNIGYIAKLSNHVALDINAGLFFSCDFAGSLSNESDYPKKTRTSTDIKDIEDYSKYDIGVIGGIGLWVNHWEVELNYQRGFASIYEGGSTYSHKLLLTLGYAF